MQAPGRDSEATPRPLAGAAKAAPATDDHGGWDGDDRPDPAEIDHGPDEELLTGSTTEKVEATALEAVPGGTIARVETDNEGAAYEAHVETEDGTVVTVKFGKGFQVLETIDGFGAEPGPMDHGDPTA